MLSNVATQKWTEQAREVDAGWQSWSQDGKYVYFGVFFRTSADAERGVFRVAVSDNKLEKIIGLKNFRPAGRFGACFSLTPEDDPLVLRDVGTQEIYALEWEAP